MKIFFLSLVGIVLFSTNAPCLEDGRDLFADLALVHKIDEQAQDRLPFYYNYSSIGGYFQMPSARMPALGMLAPSGGYVYPFATFGINFQPYERLELAGIYEVSQTNANHFDRIGQLKLKLIDPKDGYDFLPYVSLGASQSFETGNLHSRYIVATKSFLEQNLELTLGWGKGKIHGFFGAASWSPFRHGHFAIKDLSFMVEYDASKEHEKDFSMKSRWNGGISYLLGDAWQVSLSSLGGEKLAVASSLRYPLGTSKGIFSKTADPPLFSSHANTWQRVQEQLVEELAAAFEDQRLELYKVYLFFDGLGKKHLWLKVVNPTYRKEEAFRKRVESILSELLPEEIYATTVVLESDGLMCQEYTYRTIDLKRYKGRKIGESELELLASREEVSSVCFQETTDGFHIRKKKVWSVTFSPSFLTFLGNPKGKFQYALGANVSPEGYLFDSVYYKSQIAYNIIATHYSKKEQASSNPSQLLNVRTDTLRYYHSNTVSLQKAYVQRSWNLGKGCFFRLAGGYFEVAYGGLAGEFLYYPVNNRFAIGVSGAGVLKRKYDGLGFTTKINKYEGTEPEWVHFIGYQYFLNLYYQIPLYKTEIECNVGSFLARDKGIRTQVSRYFDNGVRFSLWYTFTNKHDMVDGHNYHDKGFAFEIPIDLFMNKSSRTVQAYAMSVWLRDVGAVAETGKTLINTLWRERR